MLTDFVWRSLILHAFVMGALCCMCANEHPQKHFCNSEFVLKADIHEQIELPNGMAFRIEIIKVFKGDVQDLKFIRGQYVILKMPWSCPVDNMKTGDTYVIFGRNRKSNLYTNLCYGNIPWRMTTTFYKRALAGIYKHNCNCAPQPNYAISNDIRECQRKFSFMTRRGDTCKWVKNSSFRRCRRNNPGFE